MALGPQRPRYGADLPVTVGTEMFGIQQSLLGGSALVCGHWDPSPRAALSASVYGCGMGTVMAGPSAKWCTAMKPAASFSFSMWLPACGPASKSGSGTSSPSAFSADGLINITYTRGTTPTSSSREARASSLGVGAGTVVLF